MMTYAGKGRRTEDLHSNLDRLFSSASFNPITIFDGKWSLLLRREGLYFGPPDWKPFHPKMNTSLVRSRDRQPAMKHMPALGTHKKETIATKA